MYIYTCIYAHTCARTHHFLPKGGPYKVTFCLERLGKNVKMKYPIRRWG